MRIYLQFPAGTAPLVESSVKHALRDARLTYVDDSAAIVDTTSPVREASALRFAKNVFDVVAEAPRRRFPTAVEQLCRALYADRPGSDRTTGRGFRVMFHLDGIFIPVDEHLRARLETAIADRSRGRVRPRGSCEEYWVVGRRDLDRLIVCRRLTRADRVPPERGVLSRELSALLVTAGEPRRDDVFLDPFGGSGALVRARSALAAKRIVYSDLAPPPGLRRTWTNDPRVHVLSDDATELPSVPTGSVTAIVTDPAWGDHEPFDQPYDRFAGQMSASFDRVLHPRSGRLVLLTSRTTEPILGDALRRASLGIRQTHRILVNGHPASVLIARRESSPGLTTLAD